MSSRDLVPPLSIDNVDVTALANFASGDAFAAYPISFNNDTDRTLENAAFIIGTDSGDNTGQVLGITGSDEVLLGDAGGLGLVTKVEANGTTGIAVQTGGNVNFDNGNVRINADGNQFELGAGQDASIEYDGSDLLINPQDVGTGDLVLSAGAFDTPAITGGLTGNTEINDLLGESLVISNNALAVDTQLDTGTVTASGGSTPAVDTTLTNVGISQTDPHDLVVYPDADPGFNADYAFNYDWGFQWDDDVSEVDINLTVNWDTDPGATNDVTLRWELVQP